MLSIRFGDQNEWWVSGKNFERLFQSGLDSGKIPPALEYWRDVANANGGFGLAGTEPTEAHQLRLALRDTAESEMAQLGEVSPTSEAGDYRRSLLKLLEVASPT
jgi:hypothetical protein